MAVIGLQIGFYSFDQSTYLAIVQHYLKRAGIDSRDFEKAPPADGEGGSDAPNPIRAEALRWALARGSRSGRTARQFVDDYLGRAGLRSLE